MPAARTEDRRVLFDKVCPQMSEGASRFEEVSKFSIDAEIMRLMHPMVERHRLVRTAELIGIAQDGEMAGDNLGVGRQHVVRIEQRVGIKAPDMAVKDVKIAKSKEVVAGYIVGMDVAERRAQIAQFVGMIGIGGDAGPPSRQRLIVGERDMCD